MSGAPRGSGSGKRDQNRDSSPRRDLRHHRARRRAHATSGECSDTHLVSLDVNAREANRDLAPHVDGRHTARGLVACAALDLEGHCRGEDGPERQRQVRPLALDRPVAHSIGAPSDRMLEEERQGVDPGSRLSSVEAQDHRGLSAGRHSPGDAGLPTLTEELANDVPGDRGLVSRVSDHHAHLQPRRTSHDLSGGLEACGPDTRGSENQEKERSGEPTSWTEQT